MGFERSLFTFGHHPKCQHYANALDEFETAAILSVLSSSSPPGRGVPLGALRGGRLRGHLRWRRGTRARCCHLTASVLSAALHELEAGPESSSEKGQDVLLDVPFIESSVKNSGINSTNENYMKRHSKRLHRTPQRVDGKSIVVWMFAET